MKKSISILLSIVTVMSLVILPKCNTFAENTTYSKQEKDIVDIAVSDGRFTTLVEALKAAGLVDTLKGEGPFTVFAPTDDAFKKLPDGTLDDLLKEENKDTLKDILLYHVSKDKLMAKDVLELDGKEIELANGKKATITIKDGDVFINDSKVIITDIIAKNGIIHVIDTVLIPK